MNALYLIPILTLLFLLRARWITWQLADYTAKSLFYCWRTKQGVVVADEMSQLWPGSYMLCEVWRWDFRRYVVYQDHFDAMMDFTVAQLLRNDLGWEIFKPEEQNPLDSQAPKDDDAGHGDA